MLLLVNSEKTNEAVQILKARLLEIENNSNKKKEEIEKNYTETVQMASKVRSEALKSLYELGKKNSERINLINALKAFGERPIGLKDLEIPAEYSKKLLFVKKIIYALSFIERGDVEDVKTKLLELEPGIKLNNLNQRLSNLYNEGRINAERKGRRNIYSINNQNQNNSNKFYLKLGSAYFHQGFVNIPVARKELPCMRNNTINVYLGNWDIEPILAKINRKANPNSTPRIMIGKEFTQWVEQNHSIGENITVSIDENYPNSILIQ